MHKLVQAVYVFRRARAVSLRP